MPRIAYENKLLGALFVEPGKLPSPLPGTTRWDLKAIDFALDAMSGLQQQEISALDEWRAKRARRPEGNS
jgi:hypothetical protein